MAVYQDKDEKGKPIKTKDGRSWYFKAYKNGKQYKSKRYLLKKDAEEAESLFILKRDNPMHKPFELIANDYFDNLFKIRKESTVYTYLADYNNHIKPFFAIMNIDTIKVKNIREWAEIEEKKRLSIKYLNKIHSLLNNIFDFAIKNYELEANPSRMFGTFQEKNSKIIDDDEKIRYITVDEFNQFISVIDEPLWKTFFTFAFYTGCRKGEMQALNWNDIKFDTCEIRINKTLSVKTIEKIKNYDLTSTKNNLNRTIKMNKTLIEELKKYKTEIAEKYTDYNDNWFVFGNSRFLPQTTIDRYKEKYFKLSGINEITMHEFRHSHVSLLINEYVKTSKEKNMKIDTSKFFLMMANRMGHSIDVMQKTYMHLFPTIQDEIIDLLDNL